MKQAIREVINLSWPTLVIVLILIVILRITYIVKSDRRKMVLHEEIFNLFFIAYLLALFQLVTSQDLSGGGTNFIPFKEIMRYEVGTGLFYRQVIGNILLFVPFGYFATSYCKIKDLGTITLVSILSSATIEVVQHFIGRSFDIDDIILNVVGGVIGFLLYTGLNAIKQHMPKILQKDFIYSIISIIVLVLVVSYLIKLV